MGGFEANDATLAATAKSAGPIDIAVGSTVASRYAVRRELGRGGMGAVYEVFDVELAETVALKVLRAPGELAGALERFKQEVRLARRVTHRNVARTYDLGEFGELHYLTMEMIEGASLAELLARRLELSLDRAADIGVQVCEGLEAAHAVGIVHRDLKPANILLESTGRVVLTDFGIARSTGEDAGITREGSSMIGTPTYMAPEQVRGAPVDARTDLFALGIILLEMLTGVRAFERDTAMATAIARLEDDPSIAAALADLPEPVAELISSCLQRDPDRRPASAASVAKLLVAFCRDETVERSSIQPSVETHSEPTDTGTSRTKTSSFVTSRPASQGVAVLPFRYRGPADEEYMAEVVTDEVVDALAMTHGLKVPAASATAPFAQDRDPKRVGKALEVDAVVDGTFQRVGPRVRLSARLIETDTGIQVWSERFDGEMTDLFELQDRIAKRVTESLRVQLQSSVLREPVCAEAVQLYMQARRQMKDFSHDGEEAAIELFERCLDLAPDFAPAVAGLALACSRLWFFYRGDRPGERNWPVLGRQAVARALERAGDLPETHLAAARMHVHETEYGDAARALHKALQLAPTCAAAHAFLGSLQCEAGRPEEGVRHIELATHLDPSERSMLATAARHHALHGRVEQAEEILDELDRESFETTRVSAIIRTRILIWFRRFDELDRLLRRWNLEGSEALNTPLRIAEVVVGRRPPETLAVMFEKGFSAGAAPRLETLAHQLGAETYAAIGDADGAFAHLRRAADLALVDIDWLRHCPGINELRKHPDYPAIERIVRSRADSLWTLR